jgi:hypothetical protein
MLFIVKQRLKNFVQSGIVCCLCEYFVKSFSQLFDVVILWLLLKLLYGIVFSLPIDFEVWGTVRYGG